MFQTIKCSAVFSTEAGMHGLHKERLATYLPKHAGQETSLFSPMLRWSPMEFVPFVRIRNT